MITTLELADTSLTYSYDFLPVVRTWKIYSLDTF